MAETRLPTRAIILDRMKNRGGREGGAPMTIKAGVIAGGLVFAAIVGFGSPSHAQQSQASKWCDGDGVSPDLQISGCTTLIQSGKETARNLAIAFNNRGIAYDAK